MLAAGVVGYRYVKKKRNERQNNQEQDSGDDQATMGLFKRKDSKHSIHSDRDDQDNHLYGSGALLGGCALRLQVYRRDVVPRGQDV